MVLDYKGLSVHYRVSGQGMPFMFLHGLGADCTQADPYFQDQNTFQLITVDMPGHGKSKTVEGSHASSKASFLLYSEIALAVLGELKIPKAVVGGISMGAAITIQMALLRPKLCSKLVLIRPAWIAEPALPHLEIIAHVGKLISECGATQAQQKLLANESFIEMFNGIPDAAASVVSLFKHQQIVNSPDVLQSMVADKPFDSLEDLQRIKVPVSVFGNNADPLHPPQIARAIANAIPNASYEHLPPRYLNTAAHTEEIINFLGDISPRTQTELIH